jgi:AcrR family transcriptional regulator
MTSAALADSVLGSEPAEPVSPAVRERIMAYWRDLGVVDPALAASLADECLAKARRRVGRSADEELLRRALEEVQRRFDHALAWALGLPPSQDHHPIDAARAAYLLAAERIPADRLFSPGDGASDLGVRLRKVLPRSTPPEAPLAMPEAPLKFWLFKSPHHG